MVSPASWPDQQWLDESVAILEGWGLVVELGAHATDRRGYMAGRDEDRLADLDDAFRDPGVRAIVTTRGGAGAYRIADGIDFAAVRRDPKPLVGFSDISFLQLPLLRHAGLVSIHGCLAGERATASVRHLLTRAEPRTVRRDPAATSAAIEVAGRATGPLIGGNLTAVAGSVGAGLPSLDGAILLIEAPRTPGLGLGLIDRQLTQLRRSGALNGIVGVALGLVSGFDGHVDRGWTVLDVLQDRLATLGVPVLGGLMVGHGGVGTDGAPDQDAVPIGATATLDTATGTLTVGPCVT